jgi:hypothetical protein
MTNTTNPLLHRQALLRSGAVRGHRACPCCTSWDTANPRERQAAKRAQRRRERQELRSEVMG